MCLQTLLAFFYQIDYHELIREGQARVLYQPYMPHLRLVCPLHPIPPEQDLNIFGAVLRPDSLSGLLPVPLKQGDS